MAVFRVERTRNYTIMSNYHLRDKRISLKAKGLLSQMLSLPEDWDYTLPGLASINSEGKDAIKMGSLVTTSTSSGNTRSLPKSPRRGRRLLFRRRVFRRRKNR